MGLNVVREVHGNSVCANPGVRDLQGLFSLAITRSIEHGLGICIDLVTALVVDDHLGLSKVIHRADVLEPQVHQR